MGLTKGVYIVLNKLQISLIQTSELLKTCGDEHLSLFWWIQILASSYDANLVSKPHANLYLDMKPYLHIIWHILGR